MILESLRAFELCIPFKTAFKHAAADRTSTQTVWVEARSRDGTVGYGEGCPREYVTGENLRTANRFISLHSKKWLGEEWDVTRLARWIELHCEHIDANPAAWCAVELALLDLIGKSNGQSVEATVGLPELHGTSHYTAILGQTAPEKFAAQLAYYQQAGFRDFKVKLGKEPTANHAIVAALKNAGVSPEKARADGNNVWSNATDAIHELRALDFPWWAIEEPVSVEDFAGMSALTQSFGAKIILDESILRTSQLVRIAEDAPNWILNVRVSKMGGLLRTLQLLREAQYRNIKVLIGAQVGESSLLTRAAFTAAAAAGNLLVAQEGAFGTHLLSRDVVEKPLMFDAGGVLNLDSLQLARAPGFGLPILSALPCRALPN